MKRTLILLVAALTISGAGARRIADFFVEAPAYEAAPYLDANMRMDMLDYFRSDLPSKTRNFFDEDATILSESERSLSLTPGRGLTLDYGLAVKGADSLIVVIETLPVPMPDSKVSLFGTDWKVSWPSGVAPVLADWLTDEGSRNRARVEEILPFVTASAKFEEDGNRLVFTNTTEGYFAASDSIGKELRKYLRPQITYVFNGKKFVPAG